MRVFISSVITGFEPYRQAAADAVRLLGHEVIRAEDFPALAASPQQACLAGVRRSDVVVMLLGERYGQRQASGKAATEEEFDEAATSKPLLVFTQTGVDRVSDMVAFVERVQRWAGGSLTAPFSTPDDLRNRVTRALADHAVAEQAGRIDDDEILARALALIPSDRHHTDVLAVAVAAGPRQQVLRPGQIESAELCESIKREAMFGSARVINSERGARCQIRGEALVVANDLDVLILDPLGSVAMIRPARPHPRSMTGLNPIIEEDVAEEVERSLRFAGVVLDLIDSTGRLTVVAPVASIHGSAIGWRTRAEQAASPNAMSGGFGTRQGEGPVRLSPTTRPRRHLAMNAPELAEDLTVLLRRQARS